MDVSSRYHIVGQRLCKELLQSIVYIAICSIVQAKQLSIINRSHSLMDAVILQALAFYLANFPDSRMIVWNTLLVARAIENQAYWIGVNRVGEDANDLHYSGESQVINSRGEVISKAEAYKEAVMHRTLDYEKLERFRQKFPLGPDWDGFEIKN